MVASTTPELPSSACCPDDIELARWLEGTADAETVARLEEHIDACPLCREVVASSLRAAPTAAHTAEPASAAPSAAPRKSSVRPPSSNRSRSADVWWLLVGAVVLALGLWRATC